MAVGQGDIASVMFLLKKGARAGDTNNSGRTADDIARDLNRQDILDLLQQAK